MTQFVILEAFCSSSFVHTWSNLYFHEKYTSRNRPFNNHSNADCVVEIEPPDIGFNDSNRIEQVAFKNNILLSHLPLEVN